ncbi:hypothetical protein [Psychroserpens sp.]
MKNILTQIILDNAYINGNNRISENKNDNISDVGEIVSNNKTFRMTIAINKATPRP